MLSLMYPQTPLRTLGCTDITRQLCFPCFERFLHCLRFGKILILNELWGKLTGKLSNQSTETSQINSIDRFSPSKSPETIQRLLPWLFRSQFEWRDMTNYDHAATVDSTKSDGESDLPQLPPLYIVRATINQIVNELY